MSSARFPTGQRGLPLPVVQGEEEFMEKLIEALQEIPEAAELLHCAENGGCPAAMTGLGPVHRAHVCAALLAQEKRPLLVVCSDEGEARRIYRISPALYRCCCRVGSSSSTRQRQLPANGNSGEWRRFTAWHRSSPALWLLRRKRWCSVRCPKRC